MTRTGLVRKLYGDMVESQPFSGFTQNPEEITANEAWSERALDWGSTRVDQWGNLIGEVDANTEYKGYVIERIEGDETWEYVAYNADNNLVSGADTLADLKDVLDTMVEQGVSHESEVVWF